MATHRRFGEFGRAPPLEDEFGRQYIPARESVDNDTSTADVWALDVRIPTAINNESLRETRMNLEFAPIGSTVSMFRRGGRRRGDEAIAMLKVVGVNSDDGVTSSAAVHLEPLLILDYAHVAWAFSQPGVAPVAPPKLPRARTGRPPRSPGALNIHPTAPKFAPTNLSRRPPLFARHGLSKLKFGIYTLSHDACLHTLQARVPEPIPNANRLVANLIASVQRARAGVHGDSVCGPRAPECQVEVDL